MVKERIDVMSADRSPGPDRRAVGGALLVEILGPAASGKTSLVRTLCSKDDGIRAGLDLEKTRYVRPLVRRLAPFLTLWALKYRRDRWFDRREMRSIAFLETWSRALERRPSSNDRAAIFDHGPLYRLARLREFGPAITQSEPFERWWRASLDRWLNALDMVVWLDAPDEVLLRRVQERGHWYLSAGLSLEEQHDFLDRYRSAFRAIFERGTGNGPKILRFRSDQRSVSEIADEVLAAFGSGLSQAVPQEGSHR